METRNSYPTISFQSETFSKNSKASLRQSCAEIFGTKNLLNADYSADIMLTDTSESDDLGFSEFYERGSPVTLQYPSSYFQFLESMTDGIKLS